MPCRDYYDDQPSYAERELRSRNDKLARIACNAMQALNNVLAGIRAMDPSENLQTLLEAAGVSDGQINEVLSWWKQHQEADAKAKAEEQRKLKDQEMIRGALQKLSPEELNLLSEKGVLSHLAKQHLKPAKKKVAAKKPVVKKVVAKKKPKTKVND
jgi:hypothetical protein